MRFHIFKTSKTGNINFAHSQLKHLRFPNFDILSLPGAQIRHLSEFLPEKRLYDNIVLFFGGNDIFSGSTPSNKEPEETAEELALLAEELVSLATEKVFVTGIPSRGSDSASKKKAKPTNEFINKVQKKSKKWEYRGITEEVYSPELHLSKDAVHLNGKALGGICSILKNKILRTNFANIDKKDHPKEYHCARNCESGSYNPTVPVIGSKGK